MEGAHRQQWRPVLLLAASLLENVLLEKVEFYFDSVRYLMDSSEIRSGADPEEERAEQVQVLRLSEIHEIRDDATLPIAEKLDQVKVSPAPLSEGNLTDECASSEVFEEVDVPPRRATKPESFKKVLQVAVPLTDKPLQSPRAKTSQKPPSPIHWFPRTKTESYLEKKIRLLQEKDGVSHGSLDETLVPAKLSRIEREKLAAATAAQEAKESRHIALVEATWCRILDAAGIPSNDAVQIAQEAEDRAAEALRAATEVGALLLDQSKSRGSLRDSIFTSAQDVREIERKVVSAVKSALDKVARDHVRDEYDIQDFFTDQTLMRLSNTEVLPTDDTDGMKSRAAEFEDKHIQCAAYTPMTDNRETEADVALIMDATNCSAQNAQDKYIEGAPTRKREGAAEKEANAEVILQAGLLNEGGSGPSVVIEPANSEGESYTSPFYDPKRLKSPLRSPVDSSTFSPDLNSLRAPQCVVKPNEVEQNAKPHFMEEFMIDRVKVLAPQQKVALAAVVSTHSLVNNLLEEIRDVRETGVRRISGGGLGDILKKHVSRLQAEKAAAENNAITVQNEAETAIDGRNEGEEEEEEDEALKNHASELERDLNVAKVTTEDLNAEVSGRMSKDESRTDSEGTEGGLGQTLLQHEIQLQREPEASKAVTDFRARSENRSLLRWQETEGSLGDVVFKKPLSRLEREKLAASEAAKQNGGDLTPRLAKGGRERDRTQQTTNDCPGLGDILVKRVGGLQAKVQVQKKTQSEGPRVPVKSVPSPSPAFEGDLGTAFVKRKSRLELDLEKAKTGAPSQYLSSRNKERSNSSQKGEGLEDLLVSRKSKLQQEQEAGRLTRGPMETRSIGSQKQGDEKSESAKGSGGLGDVLVKRVSRLEKEKMQQSEVVVQAPRKNESRRVETDSWAGLGLGESMKRPVSKLESEQAAWKAEAAAKSRKG